MCVLFFYFSEAQRVLVEKLASLGATSTQHSVSSGGMSSYSFFLLKSPKSLFDIEEDFQLDNHIMWQKKKIQSESMSKAVTFS